MSAADQGAQRAALAILKSNHGPRDGRAAAGNTNDRSDMEEKDMMRRAASSAQDGLARPKLGSRIWKKAVPLALCGVLAAGMCACSSGTGDAQGAGAGDGPAQQEQSSGQAQEAPQSDATDAAGALDSAFTSIASGDPKIPEQNMQAIWFDPGDYGVSADTFAGAYFDGFDYSLDTDDARANDDGTVTVPATFTTHPVDELTQSLEAARDRAQQEGADLSQDGAADSAFASYVQQNPYSTEEVQMDVVMQKQSDGTWNVKDGNGFASLLFDGFNPKQDAS